MKQILAIVMLAMTAGNAPAQKYVKKAIDELANDKSVTTVTAKKYEHEDDNGQIDTYCLYTMVHLDKKQADKISRVQEAFNKDVHNGYYFIYQTPKTSSGASTVAYGPELEYKIQFCTNKKHNYLLLFVYDKNKAEKRFVYAMVWYEENGGIRCLLYQIYGDNPAKSQKQRYKTGRSTAALADLSRLPDALNTFTNDNIIVDGDNIRIIGDENEVITIPKDKKGKGLLPDGDMVGAVRNDSDFMMQFGNLRAAFLDAVKSVEQKALQTGIVVKLAALCKEHSNLLSDNERNTCATSLTEMKKSLQKSNPDTFLNGMLDEAIIAVKK